MVLIFTTTTVDSKMRLNNVYVVQLLLPFINSGPRQFITNFLPIAWQKTSLGLSMFGRNYKVYKPEK